MRFSTNVELLDGPFRHAQDLNLAALRALDADRLLAPFLREGGLPPVAEPYGDWESRGLDGHTAGHYVSASAHAVTMAGATDLVPVLDHMVAELARAQRHLGTGYVGGIPRSADLWDEVATGIRPDTFRRAHWAPWYNLHKIYAGLIDAHRLTGTPGALEVVLGLADWWEGLAAGIDDDAFELMLETEFGGMSEAYADLYALTGDERHLAMAHRFAHRAVAEPLAAGRDELTGLHANTQIPKLVGLARIAEVSGDDRSARAAENFWDIVTTRRSVSIGGNSVSEHFHDTDDFTPMVEHREGPETCNTYNMVKLSRLLFERSGDPAYLDEIERAEFNHLLSSIHPEHGGLVYFSSMRPAHYRIYSRPGVNFWCCVGTGMETHAIHGRSVFVEDETGVGVVLYVPARLTAPAFGLVLTQHADLPASRAVRLDVSLEAPRRFALRLRVPAWASADIDVRIDGESVAAVAHDGFLVIDREWQGGEQVDLDLPLAVRTERLPDGSAWESVLVGPSVMALRGEPVDALADDSPSSHIARGALAPLAGTPLKTPGAPSTLEPGPVVVIETDQGALRLEPYAALHDVRTTVYFPLALPDVAARHAALAARDDVLLTVDGRTIDRVAFGEQQSEADHGLDEQGGVAGASGATRWRAGLRLDVRVVDPHFDAGEIRLQWQPAPPGHPFRIEVDGVEAGRVDDVTAGEVTVALAATDATWGVRRIAIVSDDSLTPRLTELRVLRRLGEEPPAATD